jgi:hypothetical protein
MARFIATIEVVRINDVDLLAAGTQILLAARPGVRFLPINAFVHLRTMTGPVLTTAPAFKIGTNAAHTNVAPLFTVPLAVAVDATAPLPLATSIKPPQGVDVVLEVATAGVGPTVMVGDLVMLGILLD